MKVTVRPIEIGVLIIIITIIISCCSIIFKVFSKSIKIETLFIWTGKNKEQNVNYIKNSPLGIQHTYSSKFPIGWNTSVISFLIWNETATLHLFSCTPWHQIFLLCWLFSLKNKKMSQKLSLVSKGNAALAQFCVLSKSAIKKYIYIYIYIYILAFCI